ncbi:MAG: hydantoinase B/oxoprolinase family protein [Porticoccaceae bacterium]|nr:hydantoinase B/oxoprolinase family protein [Porticoccaceae bacterium]
MSKWQFWVDRGGTFTDLVARTPNGELRSLKLLSENPERYDDAVLEGIRQLLAASTIRSIPTAIIESIRIGTTVATNALLERKGVPTLLVTTPGFADALQIGYQHRPDLFALDIQLPEPLYEDVLEIDERLAADGSVIRPLQAERYLKVFQSAYRRGLRAVAVVCMHSYKNPAHELAIGKIAEQAGFKQVSLSHEVSPLVKFVGRGDTTVVDAYISPVLAKYVQRLSVALPDVPLLFMQSSGGLTDAINFKGRNSLLSGPAGGVVGAVKTAEAVGYSKVLGFDMGGTSTDVWHYKGAYQRVYETQLAGVRLRVPMMDIHTVAAGGGSVCYFDGSRFRVGPESAGADPGPACYRRAGPLTITDCNLVLGRLAPDYFPAVFGPAGDERLSIEAARAKLALEAAKIKACGNESLSLEEVAAGFVDIAVQSMAGAIKTISTQRGYDVGEYALSCFGGAGGQHACAVADVLGVDNVLIHPLAGVLSALGMGLASVSTLADRSLAWPMPSLDDTELHTQFEALKVEALAHLPEEKNGELHFIETVYIRYTGADTVLAVARGDASSMQAAFEEAHRERFSFLQNGKALLIDSISIEAVLQQTEQALAFVTNPQVDAEELSTRIYSSGEYLTTPVVRRETLRPGVNLSGPLMLVDSHSTTLIDRGWQFAVLADGMLRLKKTQQVDQRRKVTTQRNPVQLEIFNYQFMAIAEQMGAVLANTAHSVNIKERFDFSCALFDSRANLIANAPHVPVHLGSMGETVARLIDSRADNIHPGDAYLVNSPYAGGTHLPDLTVVSPVFGDTVDRANGTESAKSACASANKPKFFVATRAHHADIGGITPGSMPAESQHIEEEGVLISNFLLVKVGHFREREVRELLASGPFPARNIEQNIADLQAQVAANTYGLNELHKLVGHYGCDVVSAYMQHIQDNAEEAVRRVIVKLHDGDFENIMDNGALIKVAVRIDRQANRLSIDFSGSSAQLPGNFNAPAAVCRAAVLYVLRTLVNEPIPLNAGCLRPVDIIIPPGSMLSPLYPAAVVAGNVETSQCVADALYGALEVLAGSQGTMNNLTFGNEKYQYYETICGGAGAGDGFSGASAVQVHMTNSRLTDAEILELRFPVVLEEFSLRKGSGGTGRYPGGDGILRKIRFLEAMTLSLLSGHRRVPTFGLAGGGEGAVGINSVTRKNALTQVLGSTVSISVEAGDSVTLCTPGGGGFGASK